MQTPTRPRPHESASAGPGTRSGITVRRLRKTYPGGVRALDGVDITVAPGTCVGLLGPNGAGKSTTVKILTTLSRPDEGEVGVAGIDVLADPHAARRAIGYVAQQSGADRQATGRENLLLQARVNGVDRRRAAARADELLRRFGVADAADRLVRTWSGGMTRRLDIAMALVHRPAILILDEPTTGLDPHIRAALWTEIGRLRDDDGMTILLTTHYLDEADHLADRIVIVDGGRVVTQGRPGDLKDALRGDGLHLGLADAADGERALATLRGPAGLRQVVVDGRDLRARTDNGAAVVPAVLAALEAAGVRVRSVTVSRPSLDDVYLHHTGRTFAAADQEVHDVVGSGGGSR